MKNYFNTRKKAAEYIMMTDGYDGSEIVRILRNYLPDYSSILEIGMGPGHDIPLLAKHYSVTGSDISKAFIEMYLEKNPGEDVILLDAVSLETNRTFDCIYSNKVLHHLSREDIKQSFLNQNRILNPGGIVCHSFWHGDKEIEVKGMKFQYYTQQTILDYIPAEFDILYDRTYKEMDSEDSFLLIMKKA